MKNLKYLFLDEVKDMYDAEQRITKALPKMAKAATCSDLQSALESHLEETKGHVTKLEQVFELLDEKPKAKKCEATVGILKEGDELVSEFKDSEAIDAAIVSACQKVEHYEIASYGTLSSWAKLLGHDDAAEIFEEILSEEKNADSKLTELAPQENEKALGEDSETDEDSSPASRRGASLKASKNDDSEEDTDSSAKSDRADSNKVKSRSNSLTR